MKTIAVLMVCAAMWLGSSDLVQAQVPYVSYYRPVTAYYQPVATYYAPPAVAYQPVARVRSRYRPILGGTVTRVRYRYAAPVYYRPVPVVYAY